MRKTPAYRSHLLAYHARILSPYRILIFWGMFYHNRENELTRYNKEVVPCLGVALSKSVNSSTSAGTLKPASFLRYA